MRYIYLFIFAVSTICANAQWERQSPLPFPPFDGNGIEFSENGMRGTITGDYISNSSSQPGQILETTDGGQSWHPRVLNTSGENMKAIFFLNNTNGWIAGNIGYKTIDGGANWTTMDSLPPGNHTRLFFLDKNFGYACSDNGLEITNDGGNSWKIHSDFKDADFLTPARGLAWGPDGLNKTSDGGKNWKSVYNGKVDGACVLNADKAVAYADSQFYYLDNAWETLTIAYSGSWPEWAATTVVVMTEVNLFAYNDFDGNILYSTDSGQSWTAGQGITKSSTGAFRHHIVNDSTALVFDRDGSIFKTTDAGQTWVRKLASNNLPILDATERVPGEIWAAGTDGLILVSADTGETWSYFSNGIAANFKDIGFINDSTGIAVGSGGKILRTTNIGKTWKPTAIGVDHESIFVYDTKNIFTAGDFTITKSKDGGLTWSKTFLPVDVLHYADIFALSPSDIRVVSNYPAATIFHSTDGGVTWEQEYWSYQHSLNAIFMWDTSLGWAAGPAGGIFRTTNGGASWQWISFPQVAPGEIFDIEFISPNMGFLSGAGGYVAKTVDGGLTWTDVSYPGAQWNDHVENIQVLSASEVWGISNNGDIIHTTDGGNSWSILFIADADNIYLESVALTGEGIWVVGPEIWFNPEYTSDPLVLPVELISFTARCDDDIPTLQWKAAEEINFSHYTVETSVDGTSWVDIGTVYPATSSQSKNYTYRVTGIPIQGMDYFRLRMTDLDGSTDFSPVVSARCTYPALETKVYPNPVNSGQSLQVSFGIESGKLLSWNLMGTDGRMIRQSDEPEQETTLTISTQNVPAGLYYLRIVFDAHTVTRRVIIQ